METADSTMHSSVCRQHYSMNKRLIFVNINLSNWTCPNSRAQNFVSNKRKTRHSIVRKYFEPSLASVLLKRRWARTTRVRFYCSEIMMIFWVAFYTSSMSCVFDITILKLNHVVNLCISDVQKIWKLVFHQVTFIFGQLGWTTSSVQERYWFTNEETSKRGQLNYG